MEIELIEFADRGELALIARTERLVCLPQVVEQMTEDDARVFAGYGDDPIDYEPMVEPGWPYTSCWIFEKTKRQHGLERLLRVIDGEESI